MIYFFVKKKESIETENANDKIEDKNISTLRMISKVSKGFFLINISN